MGHALVAAALAVLMVWAAPVGVGASCLVDPSTDGFLLPVLVVPGYGMCPRGYLCPNSFVTNTSTYPRYCPATDACLAKRLTNEFCEPQGTYEPYVCPAGWYCPTAYDKVICPSGHFCPLGSTAPRKCPPISQCGEGTGVVYDYGALVLVGVLDIVFLIVHIQIRRRSSLAMSRCMPAAAAPKVDEANWDGMSEEERATLCDAVSKRRGQMTGMEFAFSDLSVTIPAKDGQDEKVVLRSVDGTLRPGQVTAVMGPSGAGKTVFFTALLSKLESSWHTTGTLQINGQGPEAFERFRHVIGYVAQDDTLHQELSVEDNVWYSSEVRLPRAFPPAERAALRAAALKAFGATGIQHMVASTLSASQRKKCSIAVEVASAPSALFLDEPTSALDATAALDLCKGLTSLATQSNMTVVMVIHQPRVEIWNGLDQVLFLAPGGFTVYQGPKSRAQAYFADRLGFQFGLGNPADIIIDGIAEHRDRCIEQWNVYLRETTGASPSVTPAAHTTATSPQSGRNGTANIAAVDMFQEMTSRQPLSSLPSLHQLLGEGEPAFTAADGSDWRSLLEQQAVPTNTPPLQTPAMSSPTPARFIQQIQPVGDPFPTADEPASFAKQLLLSHNRSIQKQSTILQSVMLDLLLCMIAAAVMASAAVQTRYVGILHAPYALISPKHIAYLLPMLAMFYQIAVAATTSVTSLRSFMGERECYWREMATGGHDRLAYYCGTTVAEVYRLVLTSLHFSIVAYLMLQPLQSFWEFYVVMLLIFIGFDAQASMLSMVLRPSSAPLMVTVAGVFVALLNGYPKIPAINYAGFTYYITEVFMVHEIAYTNGLFNEPVLDQYSVDRKGLDFAITLLIIAVYRVVGFLLMKFANRDKQR